MDIFGKIEKLTKILLQKSGRTVTLDSPASVAADHTFELPAVAASGTTVLVDDSSSQTLSNKTLVTPTIASMVNANHTHADAAGGGQIANAAVASGAAIDRTKLASGTPSHVIINDVSGNLSSEAQLDKSRGGTGLSSTADFPSSGTIAVLTDITVDTVGVSNISTALNSAAALSDGAIASGAAIARSKFASGTADHVIINDASGNLSSEAQLSKSRGGTGISSTADFPASGTVAVIADITTQTGVSSINSHAIPSGTGAIVTVDSADTLTNKTLTTPTIASFANANHDHSASGANGGLIIAASATQQGAVSVAAQTFAGEKTFASGVKVDTIAEKTSGSGVNIDSVLLKDGTVQANSTVANKLPVGTTAQRGSPTAGNIRFNSNLNAVEVCDGNLWVPGTNYQSAALGIGTVSLFTPADATVVAYEATIYASNLSGSSITKVIAVQAANWEIGVTEAGDSAVVVSINASTGELSLTSGSAGVAAARIDVILYY
jgi:predicted enzyme related to lactoylglutathione lyase